MDVDEQAASGYDMPLQEPELDGARQELQAALAVMSEAPWQEQSQTQYRSASPTKPFNEDRLVLEKAISTMAEMRQDKTAHSERVSVPAQAVEWSRTELEDACSSMATMEEEVESGMGHPFQMTTTSMDSGLLLRGKAKRQFSDDDDGDSHIDDDAMMADDRSGVADVFGLDLSEARVSKEPNEKSATVVKTREDWDAEGAEGTDMAAAIPTLASVLTEATEDVERKIVDENTLEGQSERAAALANVDKDVAELTDGMEAMNMKVALTNLGPINTTPESVTLAVHGQFVIVREAMTKKMCVKRMKMVGSGDDAKLVVSPWVDELEGSDDVYTDAIPFFSFVEIPTRFSTDVHMLVVTHDVKRQVAGTCRVWNLNTGSLVAEKKLVVGSIDELHIVGPGSSYGFTTMVYDSLNPLAPVKWGSPPPYTAPYPKVIVPNTAVLTPEWIVVTVQPPLRHGEDPFSVVLAYKWRTSTVIPEAAKDQGSPPTFEAHLRGGALLSPSINSTGKKGGRSAKSKSKSKRTDASASVTPRMFPDQSIVRIGSHVTGIVHAHLDNGCANIVWFASDVGPVSLNLALHPSMWALVCATELYTALGGKADTETFAHTTYLSKVQNWVLPHFVESISNPLPSNSPYTRDLKLVQKVRTSNIATIDRPTTLVATGTHSELFAIALNNPGKDQKRGLVMFCDREGRHIYRWDMDGIIGALPLSHGYGFLLYNNSLSIALFSNPTPSSTPQQAGTYLHKVLDPEQSESAQCTTAPVADTLLSEIRHEGNTYIVTHSYESTLYPFAAHIDKGVVPLTNIPTMPLE